jgi:hypothetical protein
VNEVAEAIQGLTVVLAFNGVAVTLALLTIAWGQRR